FLHPSAIPHHLLQPLPTRRSSDLPNADAWCMRWLERFSIANSAKRRIRELSKGTAQRVALAHAMVVEPRLLILDEPLSGLDPIRSEEHTSELQSPDHLVCRLLLEY